ncbi:hypothetical protein [Bradyrhizobium sp. Tv2a-2]|uniref:hypothetical protein n=1 Tax=Bradyrhizobium sp. Tv2a-2 TaxID=113395 RepID=UPI000464D531|nr:hypothetical protein [Bradyrhizobium sp. Tv2a-2]
MTATLNTICAELGVGILEPRQQRQRGPNQTCAVGTLEELLRDEGSAHLRSVLMTIVESKNNRMALVRPILMAVSDVLRAHPTWLGSKWFDLFDEIDLVSLYEKAKADREAVAPRWLIGGMILERLRPHFHEEAQPTLFGKG